MAHRHKWWVDMFPTEAHCVNIDETECRAKMNAKEIERRINAVECLSADDVKEAVVLGWVKGVRDKMEAYATTLEEINK